MPYFGIVLKSLVWLHPGVRDPHIKKVRDAQRLAQGYESRTVVSPWACSHGCGRPRAGEVSRPVWVTNLSALLGGVPRQGGLPGQPVRLAR